MVDPGLELIPARHGRAVRLARGEAVEVVNSHGTQVLDTWAFNADHPLEFMAMDQTRSVNSSIFLKVGTTLVSDRRRPMLTVTVDTSPGIHDTLLCACNPAIYAELGCPPGHRSCAQNLHESLADLGLSLPFTPAPLNLFMNVPVAPDGTVDRLPPASRPGDRVTLEAQMDVVVVFSACPQDVTPINGAARMPTDAHYRIIARP
jgi:uncharacterized protein YcgI (DUF1989 family)